MKAVKSSMVFFLLLFFIPVVVSRAQTREDVVNKFNEGFELFNEQGDNLAAIEKFKETVELAEEVGSEADDIKERAIGQIPRLAFIHAAQLVRQRKLEEALEMFEETIALAEEYNDDQILNRARGNLPALYLNLGNQYYKNGQNEQALEQYERAIELNPSYSSAYYQIALVNRRLNNLDAALENYDISIDLARESGDTAHVERGQRSARDYLVYLAAEEIEMENYNRALDYLNRASGYGENANMHYRFAVAYNFLKQHSNALTSAEKALELENSSRSDLARIYFEIGLAHKGLGNTSQACEAMENALFGDYRALAEHEMEHELNCN